MNCVHHWVVTIDRRPEGSVYHHDCQRCGATKDVPLEAANKGKWTLQKTPRRKP